jgi:hypothetical protein
MGSIPSSFLKLLAGRLHEASRLISSNYFEKQLHTKYENEMSEKARDARRRFSTYFGGDSNVISQVRKKFAFHFDRAKIESVYAALDKDYPFVTYVGEYFGNSLYLGSEMLSLSAMAALADAPTPLDGIEIIYEDTINV